MKLRNTEIHTSTHICKNYPAPSCHGRSVFSTSRRACKELTKALGCPNLTQPVISTRCSQSPQPRHKENHWASIMWKPLAQTRNRQFRVEESWSPSQNSKQTTKKGKMELTVVKNHNHMPFSSPAMTLHHWEHYDTGCQLFRLMKSAYSQQPCIQELPQLPSTQWSPSAFYAFQFYTAELLHMMFTTWLWSV